MDLIGGRAGALCAVTALCVGLSACGDDTEGSGTSTTATIAPTSYVTLEQATTTTAGPPTTAPEPGAEAPAEQTYTVVSGDYFARIAEEHGITVEELINYNEFPEGADHVLIPGETIKIPPGAKTPEDDKGGTTDPPTDPTDPGPQGTEPEPQGTEPEPQETDPPAQETDPPAETSAPPDNCAPGTYTVREGDYPTLVAQNFDVSLDALTAANQGTEGYDSFYIGLEIVIPPASDC